MQKIEIKTDRAYEVKIGRGLLPRIGEFGAAVHAPCTVVIVADENTAALYMKEAVASFQDAGFRPVQYLFEAGERSKNMRELTALLDFMAQKEMGRADLVAALGGGVAGDLAGFAAAIYQRGIGYIQIPTTLLAAVDSSVGGKTAVNLQAGKNLAGAFWQPKLVVCDCDTFRTLPEEELAAGAAECIKYAMLSSPELLVQLTENGLDSAWDDIVARCVAYKGELVSRDEREQGLRKLLNFGHTVGHAAERLSGYALRHGEGVAVGMSVITRAAEKKGFCESGTAEKLTAALKAFGLPTACDYTAAELAEAALADKKRRGEAITLILPSAVGHCVAKDIPVEEIGEWVALGTEECECR